MEDISRLRASRKAHRSHVTRIFGKLEDVLESDNAPNEKQAANLTTCLEQIVTKKATIGELDTRISQAIEDPSALEGEILEAEEIQYNIAEKINLIKAVLARPKPLNVQASPFQPQVVEVDPPPLADQSQNDQQPQGGEDLVTNAHRDEPQHSTQPEVLSSHQPNSNGTPTSVSQNVSRLPKLTLPTFEGNPLEWQTFWDSFDSAVHSNNVLSNVQRLNYLRAHLGGEASRAIAGFPLTSANYHQSVDLLKERFGQPQRIVNAHMHALMNLSSPKNDIKGLREFHDAIENHVRGLLALGWTTRSYGALLVPMVLGKLPSDTRKNLAREHNNLDWTIDELRDSIAREIRVLEAGSYIPPSPVEDPQRSPPLTASFHAGATSQLKNPKCIFCKGAHSTTKCDVITEQPKRMELVKQEKLCYNCLGHHKVSQCLSKGRCKHCKGRHHTTLCRGNSTHNPTPHSHQENSNQTTVNTTLLQKTSELTTSNYVPPNKVCFLKTAITTIRASSHQTKANILFDEGAQRSFISEALASQLKLTTKKKECVAISAFGGSTASNQSLPVATIFLMTTDGNEIPISVLIIPKIAQPLRNLPFSYVKQLPYLKGIQLTHAVSSNSEFEISVLIGADFYWSIVQETVIRGPGPTAVKSILGYLLSGPLDNCTNSSTPSVLHLSTSDPEDKSLEENIWPTDFEHSSTSSNFLQEYLRNSVTRQPNGTYIVKFPWKPSHPPLPTNKSTCERRVRSLVLKLSKTPKTLKIYNDIVEEQLKRGFIEPVPESELDLPSHYIPHHAVRKESSTTPLRIVYDCSCREAKHLASLNDCLDIGPAFLNDLQTILIRFRSHHFGLTADIEKAFLHVQLHHQDRDFTRFLWLCNPYDPDGPLRTYRFKAVLFGAASSPFMSYAALHCHLTHNKSATSADILQNLYVDNILSGCSTEEALLTYYKEARTTLSEANFNLRSWASNSSQLRTLAKADQVADNNERVNVLGLIWNTVDDFLELSQKSFDLNYPLTKRQVLQQSSKCFDPLGIASPVTIRAKLLLQSLWQKKISWDVPLSLEHQQLWQTLQHDLQHLNQMSIPRYYWKEHTTSYLPIELHIFSDASTKAYGAVGYLRQGTSTSFVIAKARVSPLKPLTLPKLELMGAVIAAQLFTVIHNSIPDTISSVHMWSDSQIVLHWLSSDKKLKQFVSNRVKEITSVCPTNMWNYCPSVENPADLLTRGISLSTLETSSMWRHGPDWLTNEELRPSWNPTEMLHVQLAVADSEVLPEPDPDNQPTKEGSGVGMIIDISRYSSLTKLLYVTAYILRFIEYIKSRVYKYTGPITTSELSKAQLLWIRHCQSSSFFKEITNLKQNSPSNKRLPLVRQLRLFLDPSNLLRCGGRIHNAPVGRYTKFPYLLPANHKLTTLIILATHISQLHGGVNSTITALRQRYWIPSARRVVGRLLKKCVICRRVTGKPFAVPDPPPLPQARVQEGPPFNVTGVDFTGAMYVKNEGNPSESKVYICLFTCASTRAVHLEVVTDLSEKTFLQAFRRFAARRSLPRLIMSDNASTYMSASKELEKLFQSPTLKAILMKKGTTWRFIPKRAPWYGGFWERLIGMVKVSLKKVLGRAFITLTALQTIIVEVEATLNDRPLTYLSSNTEDPEPLTPSHLLCGRRIAPLPHPLTEDDESSDPDYYTSNQMRSIVDRQGILLRHFQSRWKKEYLTALREFHRHTGTNEQTVSVGDVVQIHDNVPRSQWKLAVIEGVNRGDDGFVRSVTVRTASGRTNRPIARLYPLEVSVDEGSTPSTDDKIKGPSQGESSDSRQRPV